MPTAYCFACFISLRSLTFVVRRELQGTRNLKNPTKRQVVKKQILKTRGEKYEGARLELGKPSRRLTYSDAAVAYQTTKHAPGRNKPPSWRSEAQNREAVLLLSSRGSPPPAS